MGKERNIGIDLLRILLAFAVVTVHFNATATGHVSSSVSRLSMKFLVYGIDAVVLPAVNIYVIMSGYFSYLNKRTYKHVVNSLVRLWLCLEFFSVGGFCLVSWVAPDTVTSADLYKRLFPLITGEWWYMSIYFATMLLSPFLNKAVDLFTKKDSLLFLGAMLLVCSLIPFFTKYKEPLSVNLGYSFIWFIVLYYTGAVICKYYDDIRSKYLLWIFFGMAFIGVAVGNVASKFDVLKGYGCGTYNSIVLYVQAVVCFLWFKNLTIKSKRLKSIICYLSGLSLATYIFHGQIDIGRLIWHNLAPAQYADSIKLIPVFIATVFVIYIVSILIEQLRRKLMSIGELEKRITYRITGCIESAWKRIYNLL